MADQTGMTPNETGLLVAALYFVGRVIETYMKKLIGLFGKKNADDTKARDDAKTENAERDQWAAINELRKDFSQHRLDDAQSFASLESESKHQSEILRDVRADVKLLLRRSTDQIKRDR